MIPEGINPVERGKFIGEMRDASRTIKADAINSQAEMQHFERLGSFGGRWDFREILEGYEVHSGLDEIEDFLSVICRGQRRKKSDVSKEAPYDSVVYTITSRAHNCRASHTLLVVICHRP